MKKLKTLIAFVCITIQTFAQSTSIQLYVCIPKQVENVPESSMDYLVNSICSAVMTNGLAAQSDYMTQFFLLPKVNVVSKNILAGAQQQIALNIDVTLQIVDNLSGIAYASNTISLKGVGTNETKAYNSAFRTLNKNNQKVVAFCSKAKEKIISYYDTESANIIKKANLLAEQEKYDEAFHLLSMIPTQSKKFDDAITASLDIWAKYKDKTCAVNIGKARSAWIANQNLDGANLAASYLSTIFPNASCYADAIQLYEEIKLKIGELWKFEMKQYDNDIEMKKAEVEAIKAIGIEYGKGQKPSTIINSKEILENG